MLRVVVIDEEGKYLVDVPDASGVHIVAELGDNMMITHSTEKDCGFASICKYIVASRAHINAILKQDKSVKRFLRKHKDMQKYYNKLALNVKGLKAESIDKPFEEYNSL